MKKKPYISAVEGTSITVVLSKPNQDSLTAIGTDNAKIPMTAYPNNSSEFLLVRWLNKFETHTKVSDANEEGYMSLNVKFLSKEEQQDFANGFNKAINEKDVPYICKSTGNTVFVVFPKPTHKRVLFMGKEHAGVKKEFYNPSDPAYEALTIIENYRMAKTQVKLYPNGEYIMSVIFPKTKMAREFIEKFRKTIQMNF